MAKNFLMPFKATQLIGFYSMRIALRVKASKNYERKIWEFEIGNISSWLTDLTRDIHCLQLKSFRCLYNDEEIHTTLCTRVLELFLGKISD